MHNSQMTEVFLLASSLYIPTKYVIYQPKIKLKNYDFNMLSSISFFLQLIFYTLFIIDLFLNY